MSSDEKQKGASSKEEMNAERKLQSTKAEPEKQASAEGRGEKPAENARVVDGPTPPPSSTSSYMMGQEAENADRGEGQEKAQEMPYQAGSEQGAPAQGHSQDAAPRQGNTRQQGNQRQESQQGQTKFDNKDRNTKKGYDGQPFHKDDPQKGKDEKPNGLLSRLRGLATRFFHRVKHMVERVIGRGRIPTMPKVDRTNLSGSAMDLSGKDKPSVDKGTKDKGQEKQERNWGELFFHGFARRLLGRDAYMYAVKQGEKQETDRQGNNPNQASREGNRPAETGRAEQTEHPGKQQGEAQQQEGQQQENQQQESQQQSAPGQITEDRSQGGTGETAKERKEPEEMKGKFNSLHKIITNDLEDRFTNAQEAKEAYLANYASQLAEKLTIINHSDPVNVTVSRENGQLAIRINNEQEQYGGFPSFMGCAMIKIEIDEHLNVTSAEAFVLTRQTSDGKFEGRKIDVTETLGAYIISDLAKNFREDYNRGSGSYNLASRNEFEQTVCDAAEQGRRDFMIDNISYSISVNQDNTIQIAQAVGEGKSFTIAMDGAPQQTAAAMEAYEAKAQELQDVERALESARRTYSEMEAARQPLQEKFNQASEKADEASKKAKDLQREYYQIEKRMSGPYIGAQEMEAQAKRQAELETEKKTAHREQQQAQLDKNKAHAALDTADAAMQGQKQKIEALGQKAGTLKEECREAKGRYDDASLKQKETIMEAYQAHIENVTKDRESSIRVFEEILPSCRNEIGMDLKLEDLNRAMEETGRTSIEEALSAQEMGDDRAEPPAREGHADGLEEQELGAEIE